MEPRYLIPLSEQGDGPPTFIVPSAGSTFFSFVTLARTLQAPGPVYSFSLTELEVSDSSNTTLEEIAESLLEDLRAVRPHGPYHLGGHCWGGVVALQMASRLEAQGEEVADIFLLESFVPVVAGAASSERSSTISDYADTMNAILDQTLEDARAKLSRMPKQHADRLIELTAKQIETGNVYQPATVRAPICLFRTETHGDLAFLGWESLSSSEFSQRFVPGDTHSMLEKPHVSTLCTEMEDFLGQSRG
ncbi:MAG: alpha/beta fold hydrolase [Myxococcota bacterium]|nr:alpha/beta fold hydrolase [Myxococcota bacterium]